MVLSGSVDGSYAPWGCGSGAGGGGSVGGSWVVVLAPVVPAVETVGGVMVVEKGDFPLVGW